MEHLKRSISKAVSQRNRVRSEDYWGYELFIRVLIPMQEIKKGFNVHYERVMSGCYPNEPLCLKNREPYGIPPDD